ncbi:MAG: GxxExxY protein [Chloroflexi bacterium]|nr:GxxExxY protein [Chloroflexota bacterium]
MKRVPSGLLQYVFTESCAPEATTKDTKDTKSAQTNGGGVWRKVDDIHPIHQAQLMSYLKATGLRLGFVINFNVPHLKGGIRRVVL